LQRGKKKEIVPLEGQTRRKGRALARGKANYYRGGKGESKKRELERKNRGSSSSKPKKVNRKRHVCAGEFR